MIEADLSQLLNDTIISMLHGLNWLYAIIFGVVSFDVKKEYDDFAFFNNYLKSKSKTAYDMRIWIAGGIIAIFHIALSYFEDGHLEVDYISGLLRTFIMVVIFHRFKVSVKVN